MVVLKVSCFDGDFLVLSSVWMNWKVWFVNGFWLIFVGIILCGLVERDRGVWGEVVVNIRFG